MSTRDILLALREGHLDLVAYLQKKCEKIAREEPVIQALLPETFVPERIIQLGQSLLKHYPQPSKRPNLFGIPIGVKDIFRVDGFHTRCGSLLPPEPLGGKESPAITRLKKAGAIIMGKTVTTEFACFQPGPTRNPHNTAHTPGGSSSGSAAGVARGYFPFAVGTQTAGSISRPAAYCGVVGFKPSYERIERNGLVPFSPSADHIGVFSKELAGLDSLLKVLIPDWNELDARFPRKELVFGVPDGPYLDQTTANGRVFFEEALDFLLEEGLVIKRLDTFQDIQKINDYHSRMISAEMSMVHFALMVNWENLYSPKTRETIEKGLLVADDELMGLREKRLAWRQEIEALMAIEGVDYWLTPATTDHAPSGLSYTGDPVMSLPWTYSGLPTITLPAGLDSKNGLPHGIQLAGRFGRDEILVREARLVEALFRERGFAPALGALSEMENGPKEDSRGDIRQDQMA